MSDKPPEALLPDPLKPGEETPALKQEGLAENANFTKQESPKPVEQILHWATKQFFDSDGTLLVREIGVLAAVILCGYAFIQDNGARMLDSVADIDHFVLKCTVMASCIFAILLVYRLLVDFRLWLLKLKCGWILTVFYLVLIVGLGIIAGRMIVAAEDKQTVERSPVQSKAQPVPTKTEAPTAKGGQEPQKRISK